jgi:hypothetical protein
VVFLCIKSVGGSEVIKQRSELGFDAKVLFGEEGLSDADVVELAGAVSNAASRLEYKVSYLAVKGGTHRVCSRERASLAHHWRAGLLQIGYDLGRTIQRAQQGLLAENRVPQPSLASPTVVEDG